MTPAAVAPTLSWPQALPTQSTVFSEQPFLSAPTTFYEQSSLAPTNLAEPPPPRVIDARADPRFSTHLLPIFTDVIAEQQQLTQRQRAVDTERQDNAMKTKQRISVYVWTMEDSPHTVHNVQQGSHGFTWPYFTISKTFLAAVGLSEASERGDLRMYDELDIADWVAVDVGYVIEVLEGQRIFLKDRSLRKCLDLQKCLDAPPRKSTPHLHYNLPRERAYVREMLKITSPTPSHQQTPSPLASTSSTLLPAQAIQHDVPPAVFADPTLSPPSSEPSDGGFGGFNDPIDLLDGEKRHWPSGYYVVDIRCFRECSARTTRIQHRARNRQTIFAEHFPMVRYVPSTFTDQKSLWKSAPSSLREEFIELGRCKEALWSAFARRARRAAGKGKAASLDIIEID